MARMQAVTAAIITCMSSAAVAQDTTVDPVGAYLCKLTASAGLQLNQERTAWSGTIFSVADEAVLMKITDADQPGTYKTVTDVPFRRYQITFKDFGSATDPRGCVSSFLTEDGMNSDDIAILGGRFQCRYFNTTYQVDLDLKRLLVTFEGGYLDNWAENRDTPYIAAGVCEKVS